MAISNMFGIIPAKLIRYAMDASSMQIDWHRLTAGYGLHDVVADSISFNLLVFALLVLLMALLKGFFMFLMRQTIIVASRYVEYDMKNEIYEHYQKLDYAFYSQNSTGDLMNRISEDVGRVRSYVGPAVMYTVNLGVTMVLVIAAMIQVNPTLTLLTLLPLPVLSYVIYRVERIINRKSERVQAGLSDMSTFVQESFSGIRVLKSYAAEKQAERDFSKQAERYKDASMELVRTNALFQPSLVLLIGLSTIITIAVGGYMVMEGRITLGNIAEFVLSLDAPSAAPLDTPINPGSASGLRNSPCIATPHSASTAPTSSPSKVRGRRICPRINSAWARSSPGCARPSRRSAALRVSSSGRLTGPSARDNQSASASNRPSAINSERGRITGFMAWA